MNDLATQPLPNRTRRDSLWLRRDDRTYKLMAGLVLIGSAFVVPAFVLSNPTPDFGLFLALSFVLVAILVGGYILDARMRRKFDLFSPPVVFTAGCVLSFSISGLSLFSDRLNLGPRVGTYYWINVAMSLVVAGTACLWIGYFLVSRWHGALRARSVAAQAVTDESFRLNGAIALFCVSVAAQLYLLVSGHFGYLNPSNSGAGNSGVSQPLFYCIQIGFYVLVVLGWQIHSGKSHTLLVYVYAIMIFTELAFAALSGTKTPFFQLIVALALPYYYVKGRFPVRILILGIALVIFIFPTIAAYRTSIVGGHVQRTSIADAAGAVISSVGSAWLDHPFALGVSNSAQLAQERQSGVLQDISLVIRYTPSPNPYRYGRTYALLPALILVPRFIWPDKPVGDLGYVMSRNYAGLTERQARTTSTAATAFGDLYMNFGTGGVLIGMVLFGALAGLLYSSIAPDLSAGRLSLYYMVFLLMNDVEGDITGTLNALFQGMVVVLVVNWIMGLNTGTTFWRRFIRPAVSLRMAKT